MGRRSLQPKSWGLRLRVYDLVTRIVSAGQIDGVPARVCRRDECWANIHRSKPWIPVRVFKVGRGDGALDSYL